jgi:hypothetical protein
MNWTEYNLYFDEILQNPTPKTPYDNVDYLDYTKLNQTRSKRWLKHGEISNSIRESISKIEKTQHWILITEPWCGDAAHSVPFIHLISELSEYVNLEIQLRDADSEIEKYLTNGGKSIPILVIRDENGKDLAVWGPRPADCQIIFNQLKAAGADFEAMKIALQNWYNHDAGVSLQNELVDVIKKTL